MSLFNNLKNKLISHVTSALCTMILPLVPFSPAAVSVVAGAPTTGADSDAESQDDSIYRAFDIPYSDICVVGSEYQDDDTQFVIQEYYADDTEDFAKYCAQALTPICFDPKDVDEGSIFYASGYRTRPRLQEDDARSLQELSLSSSSSSASFSDDDEEGEEEEPAPLYAFKVVQSTGYKESDPLVKCFSDCILATHEATRAQLQLDLREALYADAFSVN